MHQSKIPVQDWVWAAYMVATHTPGLTAKQLQRYLGTSSYKTAWYLLQRFRRAMVNENRTPLRGRVEADKTLIGGLAKGRKGRGVAKGKSQSLVLGMVEVLAYKDTSGTAKKRAGRVRLAGCGKTFLSLFRRVDFGVWNSLQLGRKSHLLRSGQAIILC